MWISIALVACLAPITIALSNCGGTYRGFQYTITSPNYPKEYTHGVDCVYRLEGDESVECEQVFHLQFLDFEVKALENCKGDYLLVGERNVFCGNTVGLRRFTGRNNSLTLHFHSDDKDAAKGFKILVSAMPCSLKLDPLKIRSDKGKADIRLNGYKRGIRVGEDNNNLTTAIPPRITSYLFLPPGENLTKSAITLAENLLPPTSNSQILFSKLKDSSAKDKSSSLGLPARNYGEPGVGVVDYDLPVVGNDCDKGSPAERINYDSRGQSANGIVYDPRYGIIGSNGYNSGSGLNPNYPITGYNPGYNTAYNPSNNPSYNLDYGTGYNPSYNPEYNPSYNPGYNPSYNSGYNPNYYPGYNSYYNSGYNPTNYPSSYTNYNPGYDPGYNPISGNNWNPVWTIGQRNQCCQIQSSRRFAIVSPGFPSSQSSSYSCRYTITKSSPDVCRLRLNFRYFNFGSDDPYCSAGYVEIDGRRYCGCKTGQSSQVLYSDYIAKTINVVQSNYPRGKFNGFLIDIIQEPCGTGPYSYDVNNQLYSGYGYSRRRFQRNTNETIREKRSLLGYSYPKPGFSFHHDRTFAGNSCQSRTFFDWAIASKEALLRNLRCGGIGIPGLTTRVSRSDVNGEAITEINCEDINVNNGIVQSPLYPKNYPDNAKMCYRFNKTPKTCKLELHLEDFDVEESQGCEKDYLSFSGSSQKFCGRSLNDQKTLFDLRRTNFVDVYFDADSHGTGRGFNIRFSQLPCDMSSNF